VLECPEFTTRQAVARLLKFILVTLRNIEKDILFERIEEVSE
jgi:hypothetical protein